MSERDRVNATTDVIINAAIEVHKALGPGLLESAYEACLAYELRNRGLQVESQKPLPLTYKDITLDCGYRIDLVVDNIVLVELKAVDAISPIHQAQVLSCLKLSGIKVGLLMNFNVKLLKNGLHRFINGQIN
jgi:GxxExxY protein